MEFTVRVFNKSSCFLLKLNLSEKTRKSFPLDLSYGSGRNNLYMFITLYICERIIFTLVQQRIHGHVNDLRWSILKMPHFRF